MTNTTETTHEYEIQGDYGWGWECLTVEESRVDAIAQRRAYDVNEPNIPHRIHRVKAYGGLAP